MTQVNKFTMDEFIHLLKFINKYYLIKILKINTLRLI